jgi:predicted cobalt transporter CbtA
VVSGFGVLDYFFWLLLLIAFVMEAFALVDMLGATPGAFSAADKQSKKLWLIVLIVSTVVGLAAVVLPTRGASPIAILFGILPIAAFIAAAIYLTDVRPAIKPYRKGGGSRNSGPYGPW